MYEELLKGVVDIHIHAGPSTAQRSVDAAEMLKLAEAAGYEAFVVKDHYFPTMLSAIEAEKHTGNGTCKVFGGTVLNNSVGGLNIFAADVAYQMGAKFISMPTLSAARHIETHKKTGFAGASAKAGAVEEAPIYYLDEKGELKDEAVQIIQYMANHPETVFSTGHGTAEEVDKLVHKAAELGVKKILVNHPFQTVDASLEQMIEWANLGAFIEITASAFPNFCPVSIIGEILNNISLDHLVISTDSGQKGTNPVDVLCRLISIMKDEFQVTDHALCVMMKDNPRYLMDL